MSTPAAKAQDLIKQANKKASGGGGFFGMFSDPKQRMEEAASLFREAAIQFKIAKDHKSAAEANMQAAELYAKGDVS
jgi:alpha-soluble NSF attachment protein